MVCDALELGIVSRESDGNDVSSGCSWNDGNLHWPPAIAKVSALRSRVAESWLAVTSNVATFIKIGTAVHPNIMMFSNLDV